MLTGLKCTFCHARLTLCGAEHDSWQIARSASGVYQRAGKLPQSSSAPWSQRSYIMPRRVGTPQKAAKQAKGDAALSPDGANEGLQATPRKKAKPLVLTTSFQISDDLKAKALNIADQLDQLFPNPAIPLDHISPFQLLVAVMLSAQTTDLKVNEVTPALFARAADAAAMTQVPVPEVEALIRTLGLAPTKAKNLVAMSKMLVEQHGGMVPDTFEELEALPGVGHKTASVVLSQVFNKLAFPVDTHIHRLAQRWGLTSGKSVEQTEADLKVLLPESRWRDAHLQIIYFGRQHCPAQRHDPAGCPICSWAAVPPYHTLGASPSRPGRKPAGPVSVAVRAKVVSKGKAGSASSPGAAPTAVVKVEVAVESKRARKSAGAGELKEAAPANAPPDTRARKRSSTKTEVKPASDVLPGRAKRKQT